jgi:hypothetical protein
MGEEYMAVHAMINFPIDYALILRELRAHNRLTLIGQLCTILPPKWSATYTVMAGRPTHILHFTDQGIYYLFDLVSAALPDQTKGSNDTLDDRVVAVYGTSQPAHAKRDASRMRGFVGGAIVQSERGRMDKGHFASHAQGGGLDVNLFPQRTDVNRGWSAHGQEFRDMERFCAEHPGTFFFTRPIYGDASWIPHALEYGVLLAPGHFWVRRFPN